MTFSMRKGKKRNFTKCQPKITTINSTKRNDEFYVFNSRYTKERKIKKHFIERSLEGQGNTIFITSETLKVNFGIPFYIILLMNISKNYWGKPDIIQLVYRKYFHIKQFHISKLNELITFYNIRILYNSYCRSEN